MPGVQGVEVSGNKYGFHFIHLLELRSERLGVVVWHFCYKRKASPAWVSSKLISNGH
jgi:predicted glycosyltransferase involved in capsule biosynthesis